nr:cation transporter [Gammaproteobacteria bacterium]
MARHRLIITGMTCEGSVAAVAEALRGVPDAEKVPVMPAENLAVVEGNVTAKALMEAVKSAGYGASLLAASAQ